MNMKWLNRIIVFVLIASLALVPGCLDAEGNLLEPVEIETGNAREVKTDSLVFYAPLFDEYFNGSSFISDDTIGHSMNVTGAAWSDNGRVFNGTSDYINLGTDIVFDSLDTLSIMAWVYRAEEDIAHTVVGDSFTSSSDKDHFCLFLIASNNKLVFSFGDGVGYGSKFSLGEVGIGWHFIGLGRNDLTEKLTFVIDGVVENEVSYAYTLNELIELGSADMAIGRTGMVAYRFWFDGAVSQVWIYDDYLSVGQWQNNYLATKWRYE